MTFLIIDELHLFFPLTYQHHNGRNKIDQKKNFYLLKKMFLQ